MTFSFQEPPGPNCNSNDCLDDSALKRRIRYWARRIRDQIKDPAFDWEDCKQEILLRLIESCQRNQGECRARIFNAIDQVRSVAGKIIREAMAQKRRPPKIIVSIFGLNGGLMHDCPGNSCHTEGLKRFVLKGAMDRLLARDSEIIRLLLMGLPYRAVLARLGSRFQFSLGAISEVKDRFVRLAREICEGLKTS